ncbi:serine/threonine-protein kinase PLK4-like [Anopheles darlingi]|uniref:serine/threonine-protein kinase PLK4-like n=1 Tax=Anopheles darlingi TaxID=43151 RepID=UPI00210021FF|nr:serine/threonine-protein kinase PLK4-like [Anopheles darlingi]
MKIYFGDRIEDYEVYEVLGKGGFATVYRAKCLRSGIFVAIKMINKNATQSSGLTNRVRQEVYIHSKLKHPSVLELYTYFEDATFVYLVLELATNGELQQYLRARNSPFNDYEAALVMRQVVEGVLYLHSQNILHRDISLSNLLLSTNMTVKIADFGLATELNRADEKHLTLCGTPNFISPEVVSRASHGLPADVWGLGCMLYTLLVGKPPFDTNGVKSTLTRVVISNYIIPANIAPDASDLIEGLLKKNPSERIALNDVLAHPFMKRCDPCVGNVGPSRYRVGTSAADSGIGAISCAAAENSELFLNRSPSATDEHKEPMPQHFAARPTDSQVFGSNAKRTQPQVSLLSKFNSIELMEKYNINKAEITGQDADKVHHSGSYRPVSKHTVEYEITPQQSVQKSNTLECLKLQTPAMFSVASSSNNRNGMAADEKQMHNFASGRHQLPPPLNTARLLPDRHRTKHVILSITSTEGEVVLEFLKPKGRLQEDRVVAVCRISSDGMRFLFYQPGGSRGIPIKDRPPDVPTHGTLCYTYDSLPEQHWKKYIYAARFVKMVKAKTPKITLYSDQAKCQLMETLEDYEAIFYDGYKMTQNSSDYVIKMFDTAGNVYRSTLGFPAGSEFWQKHFLETLKHCRNIDSTLSTIGTNGATFPVIIGRRPASNVFGIEDGRKMGEGKLVVQSSPATPMTHHSNTAMSSFAFSIQSEKRRGIPQISSETKRQHAAAVGTSELFSRESMQKYSDDRRPLLNVASNQDTGIPYLPSNLAGSYQYTHLQHVTNHQHLPLEMNENRKQMKNTNNEMSPAALLPLAYTSSQSSTPMGRLLR